MQRSPEQSASVYSSQSFMVVYTILPIASIILFPNELLELAFLSVWHLLFGRVIFSRYRSAFSIVVTALIGGTLMAVCLAILFPSDPWSFVNGFVTVLQSILFGGIAFACASGLKQIRK